jgi:Flp pilus assembly protein TadG
MARRPSSRVRTDSGAGALESRWHRVRGERASAAVEFALVLPLVLVMALALVQVGLLVKDQLVVAGSARAGAREGAVSTDDTQARQAAVDAASAGGLDTSQVAVDVRREGGTGTAVAVTVTYHAPVVVPLVSWLFPSSIDLTAAVTMRQEGG